MTDSDEVPYPKEVKIARLLFWINLVPAIVASIVTMVMLLNLLNDLGSGHKVDDGLVLYFVFLVIGLGCEVIYYNLGFSDRYFQSKTGWLFTIITNILFMGLYAYACYASKSFNPLIMVPYPAFFPVFSYLGFSNVSKTIKSEEFGNIING